MNRVAYALPLAVALICAVPVVAPAQEGGTVLTPKQRERERKGFSAFAATRYQEALDIYADLYADFHDPIYLRNIGRCHYKLRHPDEAIASFDEYLLKYKRISPSERAEIDGWIKDMRELQKSAGPPAAAPPLAGPLPAAPPPAPLPATGAVGRAAAPLALAARPAPPPAVQLTQNAPAPSDDTATIRHVGMGALIVGGALAAAGGIFAAASWSKFNGANNGACLATAEGCGKAADTIEQRSTLSKLFLIGGATMGVAGGALLLFFPPSGPSRAAVAGVAGTF
jgi:tetratricopeptide (TPR) repeat protein